MWNSSYYKFPSDFFKLCTLFLSPDTPSVFTMMYLLLGTRFWGWFRYCARDSCPSCACTHNLIHIMLKKRLDLSLVWTELFAARSLFGLKCLEAWHLTLQCLTRLRIYVTVIPVLCVQWSPCLQSWCFLMDVILLMILIHKAMECLNIYWLTQIRHWFFYCSEHCHQ